MELETTRGAVSLDTARTAVLVIDMQNDLVSQGGMFDRAGIDLSRVRQAVAPTDAVLGAARRAGLPIVFLKMGYRADLSDLGPPGSPNRERHLAVFSVGDAVAAPDGRASRILVRDTWNTDVIDELDPGRDVPRLLLRAAGGLQRGAARERSPEDESRGDAPADRVPLRLGLQLWCVPAGARFGR